MCIRDRSLSDSSADSGTDSPSQSSGDDPREMSEWEKKLEQLG